jgi:hypothetical protein
MEFAVEVEALGLDAERFRALYEDALPRICGYFRDRYLAYEYPSRTEDNLALTDIRAQHPNAKGDR